MIVTIQAVYEAGKFRPLEPVKLAEHRVVRLSLDVPQHDHDMERQEWLAQSERMLAQAWDNDGDDVYNELLAK
jgi:predicted DNA-binding antitoxin AbrB/MazE fold protein